MNLFSQVSTAKQFRPVGVHLNLPSGRLVHMEELLHMQKPITSTGLLTLYAFSHTYF